MKSKLFLTAMIISLLFPFFSNSLQAQTQKEFTFRVAEVSVADTFLEEVSYEKAIKRLVRDVESYPESHKNLVPARMHAFVDAVGRAYSEHRPLVISPDMIWLLICQGFSAHVNSNPEQLRYKFVTHKGKIELIVKVSPSYFKKGKVDNPYHLVFPQFTKQIKQHTIGDVYNLITAQFSTTEEVEKAAFEITLIDAMKAYFEYRMVVICGIPRITLEGTVEDWQSLLVRAKKLGQYQLNWWIDALIPILEEFVKARQGDVNRPFWNNMYIYHVPEKTLSRPCMPSPEPSVTGWIVKFFPILPRGFKNPFLKEVERNEKGLEIDKFPTGISKTKFIWDDLVLGEKFDMEFIAGFIGIEQDKTTKTLRPEIGWAVREVKQKASPKSSVRNSRE